EVLRVGSVSGKWGVLASEHDRPGRYTFYGLAGEEPRVGVVLSGWTDAGVADSDMASTPESSVAFDSAVCGDGERCAPGDSLFGPFRGLAHQPFVPFWVLCVVSGVGEPILHCH